MAHRFFEEILSAKKQGNFQFFMHGENTHEDWFYTEEIVGVTDAQQSLMYNLLNPKNECVEKVLAINENGVSLFEWNPEMTPSQPVLRTSIRPLDIRPVLLKEEHDQPSLLDAKRKATSPNSNPQQNDSDNGPLEGSVYLNALLEVTSLLKKLETPIAVILERVHWTANLFPNKDHHLGILKEIDRWRHISKVPHLSFILVDSIDLLKNYFPIHKDYPGDIYVAGPSIQEITDSLESYQTRSDHNIIHPRKVLESIASILKNKGTNLLNGVQLFADTKKRMGDDFKNSESLVREFKHQLKSDIDETKWEDVFLNHKVKNNIIQTFKEFQNTSGEGRKHLPKGNIFYGPPGTGKTLIAKALARSGGYYFMAPKLADIKGEFVGQSGKNLQRIFKEARACSPTLIFLDELDALFSQRGGNNQDSFNQDIINQFLAEVDGVDTGKQDIFIIGATNRMEMLDSAVKSRLPGIHIGLPDEENRQKMFERFLNQSLDSDPELKDVLITKSNHLSGRDIKNISFMVGKEAIDCKELLPAVLRAFENFKSNFIAENTNATFQVVPYHSNRLQQGFSRVLGYSMVKAKIHSMVNTALHNKTLAEYGLGDYNGMLLFGPPGNGKTNFAVSAAEEFKLDFVKLDSAALASPIRDETIRLLKENLLKAATLSALNGVLLFFDEFDAIASGNMESKFRGALLNAIDEIRANANVILMAATNFAERLDEAVVRNGRFDEHIFLDNPSTQDQIILLAGFISQDPRFKLACSAKDFATQLQERLELPLSLTSISTIKNLVHKAKRTCVMRTQSGEELLMQFSDFEIEPFSSIEK